MDENFNGNGHITINHWTLQLVPGPGNMHSSHCNNLLIKTSFVKNFPTDLSVKYQNISVISGETVTMFLSHSTGLTFEGNHSMYDFQSATTRVTLIHSSICALMNSTPFQLDNAVNHVYLDAIYEERRLFHEGGICSIFKSDLPCSDFNNNFIIDFLPTQMLFQLTIELNIKLTGCVQSCHMNVSVLANMENKLTFLKLIHVASASWVF